MVTVSSNPFFVENHGLIGHIARVDDVSYFIAPAENEIKVYVESNDHYEFLKNIKLTAEMDRSMATRKDFIKYVTNNMRNWLEV